MNNSAISSFSLKLINQNSSSKLKGYYLTSTASIHVENTPGVPILEVVNKNIGEIADHLIDTQDPQLIISIHGYANKKSDAENRYKKICEYAQKPSVCKSNTVFVGYRWPAENVEKDDIEPCQPKANSFADKVKYAFASLPTLLLGVFISSLVLGTTAILLLSEFVSTINLPITLSLIFLLSATISYGLSKFGDAEGFIPTFPNGVILICAALLLGAIAKLQIPNPATVNILLLLLAVIFVLSCGIVLALIALKLSTYQSDRYRANNYGVVDMIDFIRRLDNAINEKTSAPQNINKPRIKLSFINHSLGCEVVTQTIRILSDVFHKEINVTTPEIGNVFSLGRLVLVAPDIPIESILSGRANFLRASLRRCEEAYVFSNEADLALRLASTAANYSSFPAKTRFRGYKLGNITIKHPNCQDIKNGCYGIINQHNNNPLHEYLEVRASNLERKTLKKLIDLNSKDGHQVSTSEEIKCLERKEKEQIIKEKAVADCFTYFDCTDYVDIKTEPKTEKNNEEQSNKKQSKGLLSFASRKPVLNFWWDYILLTLAYFLHFPKEINVHGGYFDGEFSQRLIYDIAFLGFKGMLEKNYSEPLIDGFSKECQDRGIKVLLASKDLPNQAPIQ